MTIIKDDYPASTSTEGVLAIGETLSGVFNESWSDEDWFKLNLTAGEPIKIEMKGGESNDPDYPTTYTALSPLVYDSLGNYINASSWSQFGAIENVGAYAIINAPSSGDYYFSAYGTSGLYEISATAVESEHFGKDDYANTFEETKATFVAGTSTTFTMNYLGDIDFVGLSNPKGSAVTIEVSKVLVSTNEYGSVFAYGYSDPYNADGAYTYYPADAKNIKFSGDFPVDSKGAITYQVNSFTEIKTDATTYDELVAASKAAQKGGEDSATTPKIKPITTKGDELNNIINGGIAVDKLDGGDGSDRLYGNGGKDRLIGGKGNDTLNGGSGSDDLFGNEGADIFQLANAYGADKINDFSAKEGDKIQLSTAVFTALQSVSDYYDTWSSAIPLSSAHFKTGAAVTKSGDADDFFIYDSKNGTLYYDDDANGKDSDPVRIAILGTNKHPTLTSDAFMIVS